MAGFLIFAYGNIKRRSSTRLWQGQAWPHDTTLPFQPQLVYSQTLLGSLFVRSYRLFLKDKLNHTLIFLKRVNLSTEYLFLRFIDSSSHINPEYLSEIQASIANIRTFKQLAP
jgi:hypothetical protein